MKGKSIGAGMKRAASVRPKRVLTYYLMLILIFAGADWLFGCVRYTNDANTPVGLWGCLYFSIVTVTTLGYGDLTPSGSLGMTFAAAEALFGIVVIGLFLNSLWQVYTNAINETQKEAADEAAKEAERRRFSVYKAYFEIVYRAYCRAQRAITLSPELHEGQEVHLDFTFHDLQHMYVPTLNLLTEFNTPAIATYFKRSDDLVREIRFMMANFHIYDHPDLHRQMIEFLRVSDVFDARGSLLLLPKLPSTTGKTSMADDLVEMIKGAPEQPTIDAYPSHMLKPAVVLFHAVRFQAILIQAIWTDLVAITGRAPTPASRP
jgi:hypothetical protein